VSDAVDDERAGRVSRDLVYHSPDELIPPPWPPQEDLGPAAADGVQEPPEPDGDD
jgi:hypothetical protein